METEKIISAQSFFSLLARPTNSIIYYLFYTQTIHYFIILTNKCTYVLFIIVDGNIIDETNKIKICNYIKRGLSFFWSFLNFSFQHLR